VVKTKTAIIIDARGQKELAYMFLFFSSRLGCLGSIAISIIVTLILLAVFHVL